ncbi:MAG: hypothetical protein E7345_02705 [Clostridiales bacterium]|nr:hypothetical protein [Clostridiales bacterium]
MDYVELISKTNELAKGEVDDFLKLTPKAKIKKISSIVKRAIVDGYKASKYKSLMTKDKKYGENYKASEYNEKLNIARASEFIGSLNDMEKELLISHLQDTLEGAFNEKDLSLRLDVADYIRYVCRLVHHEDLAGDISTIKSKTDLLITNMEM